MYQKEGYTQPFYFLKIPARVIAIADLALNFPLVTIMHINPLCGVMEAKNSNVGFFYDEDESLLGFIRVALKTG